MSFFVSFVIFCLEFDREPTQRPTASLVAGETSRGFAHEPAKLGDQVRFPARTPARVDAAKLFGGYLGPFVAVFPLAVNDPFPGGRSMVAVVDPVMSVDRPTGCRWLPLVIMPTSVIWLSVDVQSWLRMWLLAGSIYAGLKWLTFADFPASRQVSLGRKLSYLLVWPGMNAPRFLDTRHRAARPKPAEWLFALGKTAFGLLLFLAITPLAGIRLPLIAGWMSMIGMVFILHFGIFHLLSVLWRTVGIDAYPVMNAPILSCSVAEFWGRRWNLAFRDLVHPYIFRPLAPRLGPAGATIAVFLVSGLVHDLVISLPAQGGFGFPTLYFLIQGFGILIERSRAGRQWKLGSGISGRCFCAAVTIGPIGLLFHRPFVMEVVLPMLIAIGVIS